MLKYLQYFINPEYLRFGQCLRHVEASRGYGLTTHAGAVHKIEIEPTHEDLLIHTQNIWIQLLHTEREKEGIH